MGNIKSYLQGAATISNEVEAAETGKPVVPAPDNVVDDVLDVVGATLQTISTAKQIEKNPTKELNQIVSGTIQISQ